MYIVGIELIKIHTTVHSNCLTQKEMLWGLANWNVRTYRWYVHISFKYATNPARCARDKEADMSRRTHLFPVLKVLRKGVTKYPG